MPIVRKSLVFYVVLICLISCIQFAHANGTDDLITGNITPTIPIEPTFAEPTVIITTIPTVTEEYTIIPEIPPENTLTPVPTYTHEDPFIKPEPTIISPPITPYSRFGVFISIGNFFKTIHINTNKMIQLPVFRNVDTQEIIPESEIQSTTTDGNIEVSVANDIPVVYSQGDEIVIIRTQ